MKLVALRIENFKRIESVEIPLSDVNVLVGANGCGKSSIVQAIHLGCCVMRQADRVDSTKTSTVSIEELDYLPTDDYKTLGHGANWGNKTGTPSSTVALKFIDQENCEIRAECVLRSARNNAGISISGTVPSDLSPRLRAKRKFFSAYIPGISGIPNKEEKRSKKVVLKACSYGDSNVYLRNVLLLLKQANPENISLIEQWIGEIIGPVTISVDHVEDTDLFIRCEVQTGGSTKPIELAGTGYLQLIQIFAYILLFAPGVLLIDEPDIHLHPHVQEKLVGVLANVAYQRDIRVILTTHSPFIVRGAPVGTNICWLQDGCVESNSRELVETALGWGAFGKQLILVSEDKKTDLLRKIVDQWPSVREKIAFYPGNGYSNIPTPEQAREMAETLGGKYKIVVHRDRDSLTDQEAADLVAKYTAEGIDLWLPSQSDVESYFCDVQFLETFLNCTQAEAEAHVTGVLVASAVPIRDQFEKQRAAHNKEFYAGGGSPLNDDVWNELQARPLKGAKGKFVFNQLKNRIPGGAFSAEKIITAPLGGMVALDLKHKLEQMLAG